MEFNEFFDTLLTALIAQSKEFDKTGIMPELNLDGHDDLKLDPSDSPELRRRIIMFKAKLAEWRAIGRRHDNEREHANYICVENLDAILTEYS
jgi:hypothetical protein